MYTTASASLKPGYSPARRAGAASKHIEAEDSSLNLVRVMALDLKIMGAGSKKWNLRLQPQDGAVTAQPQGDAT